ncbi:hypothetical protein LV779_17205 [Streptomyces thinghirensis]|nr:hypothetical protein [Streptomyces thinghirensis]
MTVAPAASRLATVIEVRAQNAPGLLFRLEAGAGGGGRAGYGARTPSTLGSNAVDAFYVTGPEGALLPGREAGDVARALEEALRG